MIRLVRVFGALLGLGLLPHLSPAQVVQPLGTEPAHAPIRPATTAARPAALALPFFDDFSRQPEGQPSTQRWTTHGGGLVNNRFPRRPISRNVVTLDGLDEKGQPRGAVSRVGDADSLTSQPIDLSGLKATDNVFLSFFWQAGTLRGRPEASGSRPIALYVEFKTQSGLWQEVWQLPSPADTTNFRFKALPLNQAAYFHPNFQFRIRVSGYLYNARDAWSVDYVRLDRNRTATDSTFRDIATSKPLGSALKRFTAMPVAQFNLNASQELATRSATSINNLDAGPAPTPITWNGYLDVLPGNGTSRYLNGGISFDANRRQQPIIGNPALATVPLTPAAKHLRQRVVISTGETNPLTLGNDTISRLTDLTDYYAYDDGTAEASISLAPAATGPASFYALRFDLNRPDQIRAIRLYPVLGTAAGRFVTVNIWDDNGQGQPTDQPKASKGFTVPATLPAGQTYVEVAFDAPVPVSGKFYAGYGHAPTPQFVEFGLDLNNAPPAGYFQLNTQGTWGLATTATNYSPAGALMVRPLTTGVITATTPLAAAGQPRLYPNPTPDGRVRVSVPYARATVLDAVGRVVWEQPASRAGEPQLVLPLPAGLYFVRLTLTDGQTVTQRLAVGGR
ncbi:T9SS type A sorting domain-containing protein [Hymenobacter rubripertinctus]|uniref:T9SS C-terminal target domain-containing protein n=1 Tax=Hymenobacter rubripertinctus TaxID=2029981 RepID=A0A418QZ11_9BACT|nr:T9SS type A sorting domain-containing protein [Hymenobacter rubripertinctus]RIY10420.1 T9SS C-terminal target domain-containing protein [Hymenobacter rubripertinctus]